MATKKAGSTSKKTTKVAKPVSPTASKPTTTTTKVTTVSAVAPAKPLKKSRFGGSRRTYVASALIAEFIGAFLLTAAFIITKGESLYLGFTLVAIVLMIGTLSGAHVNPLITVGAWVTRRMTHLRAVAYIVAQVLGATLAFVALTAFIGAAPEPSGEQAGYLGAAAPALYEIAALTSDNQWYIFFAELIGATIFAFAFAGARRATDLTAKAFGVGFGLFVAVLIASVVASYASGNVVVNPAVALTVGAIDWSAINWMAVASYFVAPLLGGVFGFALQDVLRNAQDNLAEPVKA